MLVMSPTWCCTIAFVHCKSLRNWEPIVIQTHVIRGRQHPELFQEILMAILSKNCQYDQRDFSLYKDTLSFQRNQEFAVLYSVRMEYCMKGSAERLPFPSSISGLILIARYSQGNTSYCHNRPSTNILFINAIRRGPGISVGIATHYGLNGPGIESRWRRDFTHPSRPALRPTQPPIQWVPGLSWG